MSPLDRLTRSRSSRLVWSVSFLIVAAVYAWAVRADHPWAPVLSVVSAVLLTGTLLSVSSAAGRARWTREPDPELARLRSELTTAKATVAGLESSVRAVAQVPPDLERAMAQIEHLNAELSTAKDLLRESRAERPSLGQLLDAAWKPGDETRGTPQAEADFARLREALQSSERELRNTRDQVSRLEQRDPTQLDDRVRELQESVRRSEAERALLRAGRPETVWEARVRDLQRRLRGAEARAAALGAASETDSEVVARIERAEAGRLEAEYRAQRAEERATGVEIRARELAREVKTRFAEAEKSWQATASGELGRLRSELEETVRKLRVAEEHVERASGGGVSIADVQSVVPGALDVEVISALEARVQEAEERAREAEVLLGELTRTDVDRAISEASDLRRRLSYVTDQRRHHGPAGHPTKAPAVESGPLDDLREAIAYELRGPVASLRGLSLALKGSVSTPEGRDLVHQLAANVRKADQLVQDLAAAANLAEGSIGLKRRRIDVTALVTRVVDEADGFQNRVLLLEGEPVTVSLDPARVEQIVSSLLANARVRTTKGQTIRVRIAAADDASVVIAIDDDGRSEPRIGAELSLAIRLAEAHGGRLWVEPLAPGRGGSFRVELREGPARAGAASGASA